jgi:hypothetical protein
MTRPEPDDANKYVADILKLNVRLNSVTSKDDMEKITIALNRGNEQYFGLVFRRLSLGFHPKDTAIVLWLLDLIQARLAHLEKLQLRSGSGKTDRAA